MCKNLAHLKFRIVENLKNIFNMQKPCILKPYNHEKLFSRCDKCCHYGVSKIFL